MAEEHRRPQARVVVEVVVGLGQTEEGIGIQPVVVLRPINPDQDDLAVPLTVILASEERGMSAMWSLSLSLGMSISHLAG